MVIETRVIPLFVLNVATRTHFWHQFFYFEEFKYQDGHHLPITFFSVFSNITHITCWISHEKLVFSNICLFPGIISCILTSPNIKIQDGYQRPYWKFDYKENSPGNRYDTTSPINHCTQSPFLASVVYFDVFCVFSTASPWQLKCIQYYVT